MVSTEKFRNIPRGILIVGGLAALILVVTVGSYMLMSPKNTVPASATKDMKTKNKSGGVGGEGTPQYNQMVEELNKQKAYEAAAKGESYVPLPIGKFEDVTPPETKTEAIVKKNAPAATPAARQAAAAAAKREQAAAVVREGRNKAFEADLKNLINRTKSGSNGDPFVLMVAAAPALDNEGEGKGKGQSKSWKTVKQADNVESGVIVEAKNELRPGKIIYAINDLAINTDAPSPVMATVARGPLKGAKVMGSFQRNGTTLIIAYSAVVLSSGESLDISGVAIDPSTQQTDVASDYDTHFLQRWGSLIGASFLEGFGQAMSTKNQSTTVDTGNTVVVDSKDKSYKDVTFEAFGKVGTRSANILERGFDRPPTVYMDAGQPVGILILESRN